MIYRVLYHQDKDQQPECAPEARECRKLLLRHLDDNGLGRGSHPRPSRLGLDLGPGVRRRSTWLTARRATTS